MGLKRGLARQALSRKFCSLYATKPATFVRDAEKKLQNSIGTRQI